MGEQGGARGGEQQQRRCRGGEAAPAGIRLGRRRRAAKGRNDGREARHVRDDAPVAKVGGFAPDGVSSLRARLGPPLLGRRGRRGRRGRGRGGAGGGRRGRGRVARGGRRRLGSGRHREDGFDGGRRDRGRRRGHDLWRRVGRQSALARRRIGRGGRGDARRRDQQRGDGGARYEPPSVGPGGGHRAQGAPSFSPTIAPLGGRRTYPLGQVRRPLEA